jgi:N-acetylneuraminate synthase
LKAKAACGSRERVPARQEIEALDSLKRGVYAKAALKPGGKLTRADVYFAMPLEQGQLSSGEWKDGAAALQPIGKDQPLRQASVELPAAPAKAVLFHAIHTIKAMLNEARIALPTEFRCEFSHHYGLERFLEVGCTIIECINREYCKKLIIQMPGQRHPSHYHKRKEETFQVLSGVVELELEGRRRTLLPGDIQVVPQGCWHDFQTQIGVIFEEISTTHYNNDSFYEDKRINTMDRSARKTIVNNWGRYQI